MSDDNTNIDENADSSEVPPIINNRRSQRDPNRGYLEKTDVKKLIHKLQYNNPDTVVLKLKDHLSADIINSLILEEIISTLYQNHVCQALYFQNISRAMNDDQLILLTSLLKIKPIWCLNLGENYNISKAGWAKFCESLCETMVTHIYISEHVISPDLKNNIRANIRENRKKQE